MKNYYNQSIKYLELIKDSIRLETILDVKSGRSSVKKLTSKAKSDLTHGWRLVKQLGSRTIFRVDKKLDRITEIVHGIAEPMANPLLNSLQEFFEAEEMGSATSGENNEDEPANNVSWYDVISGYFSFYTRTRVRMHLKSANLFQTLSSEIFRFKVKVRIAAHKMRRFWDAGNHVRQEPLLIPLEIENNRQIQEKKQPGVIRKRFINIFTYFCSKFYFRICFLIPTYCKPQRFSGSNLSIRIPLPNLSSGFP